PTLSGKAEADAKVTIYDNGSPMGSVVADKDGKWSYTPTTPISEGSHTFTADATDKAGNTSGKSDPFNIVTDYTPPAKPTIDQILDDVGSITGPIAKGGVTDDSKPTLSGTTEANATVTVYDNGSKLGTATAGADGKWSFTPTAAISEGAHAFTVDATDKAGNTSAKSDPFNIVTDYTPPAKPSIDQILDDVGSITGPIAKGGVTDDSKPTLSGAAEANATVTVYDNGNKLGVATAGADGKWSFTPTTPISEGAHAFTVDATDKAGNTSVKSDPFNIVTDYTPPAKPVIEQILDDVGSITGPIAQGGVTDDSKPTLSGTTEANATVTVYDNGSKLGTATAGADGKWSFTPTAAISEGAHAFTIDATDKAGNTSVKSDPFNIVTDYTPPAKPVIEQILDDVGSITGPIAKGGVTDDSKPTLSGTTEAGAKVTVYDNGTALGTATAGADGKWSFTPTAAISEGAHAFTVDATDKAGNTSAKSDPFNIVTDYTPPAKPTIDQILDDVGSITGPIAKGGVTDDSKPTLSGSAESGSTVTVYDNGSKLGTVTADGNGKWSFTPTAVLSEGKHDFTVDASDKAGNTSPKSDVFSITTDYTPPTVPVIVSVYDAVGDVQGNLKPNDTTDDNKPKISGTGEANSTVKIYDKGVEIGNAAVNGSGQWTFTPTLALGNGDHTITAKGVDAAGNISGASNSFGFTVAAGGAPAAPSITHVIDDVGSITGDIARGGATDDARPEIQGTAEANSKVRVYIDGVESGSTTAGADGKWSFTPAANLA
ncbi:Ig-like domain-containing protein, partial [Pseudomonas nitroreducens]